MLQPSSGQAIFRPNPETTLLFQMLLFVDNRTSSQEYIRQIHQRIHNLNLDSVCELQVIEIGEQPHLVEHFRLMATPALVKIKPEPRQTLAGSDLVAQLEKWLPHWQRQWQQESSELTYESLVEGVQSEGVGISQQGLGYSGEILRLSDEIFRLKREKEELFAQLQFRDQALAMLAHDLRSPLTAAAIALETLEKLQKQPELSQKKGLSEHLYQQTKNQFKLMNRMITEILQTSKSISGKLELQPSKLYLQSLCVELLQSFEERLQRKGLTLVRDLPQDLPAVYADRELIGQVIINLVDNAIKYTPEGGKITLSILHRTTQKVQVTVMDTGPGIPETLRDRIFEGHFRLKRDQGHDGYGLGLFLCRKIVRAHYGEIWVNSDNENGSCFHFTLPVY